MGYRAVRKGVRDHPRSRGVYMYALYSKPRDVGSSPLARGLPAYPWASAQSRRIIPARAGFTGRPSAPSPATRDHPRSRGVYKNPYEDHFDRKGSSPLARGLPRSSGVYAWESGIIPARAGFTPARHGRGNNERGSSPLARGLPLPCSHSKAFARIIPARAGFTYYSGVGGAPISDHPRSRGVYSCGI